MAIRRAGNVIVFTGALGALLWFIGSALDAQSPLRTIGAADCSAEKLGSSIPSTSIGADAPRSSAVAA
jgi:hypothetical protein